MSLGIFQLQGGDVRTAELHREQGETLGTDAWRFNDLSHPCSNTSLKVGTMSFLTIADDLYVHILFIYFSHQLTLT